MNCTYCGQLIADKHREFHIKCREFYDDAILKGKTKSLSTKSLEVMLIRNSRRTLLLICKKCERPKSIMSEEDTNLCKRCHHVRELMQITREEKERFMEFKNQTPHRKRVDKEEEWERI